MYSWYSKIKEYMINERKYKSFLSDDITNEKKFEKIIKQNKKTKKNRNERRKRKWQVTLLFKKFIVNMETIY